MVPQLPTSLRASGVLDAEQVSWSRELASLEGKTTTAQAKDLRDVANHLRKTLETYATRPHQGPPNLPVMAYYGTGRLWSEGRVVAAVLHHDPLVLAPRVRRGAGGHRVRRVT
jgi:predicted ATP-binding protein involved in virulence